jgi:hypothetical protein
LAPTFFLEHVDHVFRFLKRFNEASHCFLQSIQVLQRPSSVVLFTALYKIVVFTLSSVVFSSTLPLKEYSIASLTAASRVYVLDSDECVTCLYIHLLFVQIGSVMKNKNKLMLIRENCPSMCMMVMNVLCVCVQGGDECVLDMMDRACPLIIERVLPHMPGPEKVCTL